MLRRENPDAEEEQEVEEEDKVEEKEVRSQICRNIIFGNRKIAPKGANKIFHPVGALPMEPLHGLKHLPSFIIKPLFLIFRYLCY